MMLSSSLSISLNIFDKSKIVLEESSFTFIFSIGFCTNGGSSIGLTFTWKLVFTSLSFEIAFKVIIACPFWLGKYVM